MNQAKHYPHPDPEADKEDFIAVCYTPKGFAYLIRFLNGYTFSGAFDAYFKSHAAAYQAAYESATLDFVEIFAQLKAETATPADGKRSAAAGGAGAGGTVQINTPRVTRG